MTRSRASAKQAGARFERVMAVTCSACGKDRMLAHPKLAGAVCRQCAAITGSRAAREKLLAVPIRDRISASVEVDEDSGCWIWVAYRYGNGYGALSVRGRQRLAHRVSYEAFVGEIPDGLVIDHLCENKPCVNPGHLEPVTSKTNTRRAMRSHCVNGHEFTPENTYKPKDGKRYCRTCRRRRVREYQDAKK